MYGGSQSNGLYFQPYSVPLLGQPAWLGCP